MPQLAAFLLRTAKQLVAPDLLRHPLDLRAALNIHLLGISENLETTIQTGWKEIQYVCWQERKIETEKNDPFYPSSSNVDIIRTALNDTEHLELISYKESFLFTTSSPLAAAILQVAQQRRMFNNDGHHISAVDFLDSKVMRQW